MIILFHNLILGISPYKNPKTEMRKIYYNRKSIRLQNYNYFQNGMYFITICTKNRETILSQIEKKGPRLVCAKVILTQTGKFINDEIKKLKKRYPIKIEKYVIMPDHIHLIINICKLKWDGNEKYDIQRADTRLAPTIGDIICAFKSITSNGYIKYNKQIGEYKQLWQRGFYEHIIRDGNEYCRICKYIKNNPRKWINDLDKKFLDKRTNV